MTRPPTALLAALVLTSASVVVVARAPGVEAPAQQRRSELRSLIATRTAEIADQGDAVVDLRERLSEVSPVDDDIDELARLAGATEVHGAGVVVILDDAATIPDDAADPAAHRIVDSDVVDVVNALYRTGATAVSINGQRLVATSPIRNAGGVVTVNFRPLSPPYRVLAVGARRSILETTPEWRQLETWSGLFGLRVSVSDDEDVVVPAHVGRLRTERARPVETP